MHPYERDPCSGAGNCACGWPERSREHPHTFTQSAASERCACSWPAVSVVHLNAATAAPRPVQDYG